MDLLKIIKGRRSIRAFDKNRKINRDTIRLILEAARWAPSGGNVQPWRFYVITELETKKTLVDVSLKQKFIMDASVVIIVCIDKSMAFSSYGERGSSLYAIQDTAAAIQNMLLTAHSIGLGSCWVGAFKEKDISNILSLPDDLRPVAIVPIGYPVKPAQLTRRKPIEEITAWVK